FFLVRTAQAMLPLVVGVAVNRREDAEIVLTASLEIVVAYADEQRRAGQVVHVVIGSELQIVDECPLVIGGPRGRGHLQPCACGPQRLRGELLVAFRGEVRLDGVRASRVRRGESAGGEEDR